MKRPQFRIYFLTALAAAAVLKLNNPTMSYAQEKQQDVVVASGDGMIFIPAVSADAIPAASADTLKVLTLEEQASRFNYEGHIVIGYEGGHLNLWEDDLVDASQEPTLVDFIEKLKQSGITVLSKVYASQKGLIVLNIKSDLVNKGVPSVMVIDSAAKQPPFFYNISAVEQDQVRSQDPNYSDLLFTVTKK